MGKRQDTSTEDDIVIDVSEPTTQKKHKKHKHKKHKKRKTADESEDIDLEILDDAGELKLKMKLAKEVSSPSPSISGEKVTQDRSTPKLGEKLAASNSSPKIPSKKKKSRGKDSGTSSEEERWLDAIESGKLEEVDDELKKIKPKDPKLMTARQRAMFERKSDKEPSPGGEQLLALPSGYKEKVMTVEALQKAALKSQKRKQQADEKREKDKKKTMERLLKKQDSKSGKTNKSRSTRRNFPLVTYCDNADGIRITLPPGVDFPLSAPTAVNTPALRLCGVQGCPNARIYSCAKTGVPLCSLACYKKNLAAVNLTDSRLVSQPRL